MILLGFFSQDIPLFKKVYMKPCFWNYWGPLKSVPYFEKARHGPAYDKVYLTAVIWIAPNDTPIFLKVAFLVFNVVANDLTL